MGCKHLLTYDEAKTARENAEGNNVFYKKGHDEHFSNVKGKETQRRERGTGRIHQRENGHWRICSKRDGTIIFDKTFKTNEEAEIYRQHNA